MNPHGAADRASKTDLDYRRAKYVLFLVIERLKELFAAKE
jgi:hypothetical protein